MSHDYLHCQYSATQHQDSDLGSFGNYKITWSSDVEAYFGPTPSPMEKSAGDQTDEIRTNLSEAHAKPEHYK